MISFDNITVNDLKHNLSPNERKNYMNYLMDKKRYSDILSTFFHPNYESSITSSQEKSLTIFILSSNESNIIEEFLNKKVYFRKSLSSNFKKIVIKNMCKIEDGNLLKTFFKKILFKLDSDDIELFIKTIPKYQELQSQSFLFDFMNRHKDEIDKYKLEKLLKIFCNLENIKSVYLLCIIKTFKSKLTDVSISLILIAKNKDPLCVVNNEILEELNKIIDEKKLYELNDVNMYVSNEKIISILNSDNIGEVYFFLKINAEKLEEKIYYMIVRRLIYLSTMQNNFRNLILYIVYQDASLLNILYEDNPISKLYVYINESNEFNEEEKRVISKDLLHEQKQYVFSPVDEGNILERFDKKINN